MAKFDLREYARQGAQARAAELEAELADIYRIFPDLRGSRTTKHAARSQSAAARKGARRRRKPMTAAQRKAVGDRMKRYWAQRRKAKQGKTTK